MFRAVVLRLFGFVTAAALGAVAVTMVAYATDRSLGGFSVWLDDLPNRMVQPLDQLPALAAGVLMVIVALTATILVMRRERSRTIRLRRGSEGRSTVDRSTLAASLQRSLRNEVHPEVAVAARPKSLRVVTPTRDPRAPLELVSEVVAAMPVQLQRRGITDVRYRVVDGARTKRRVR